MIVVSAGVVKRDGRIMICQRKPGVHNGLKWEFPGGKLEKGESPEAALARELMEELGINVTVGRVMDVMLHSYPDRDVLILFYPCTIAEGEPAAIDCNSIAWAEPGELLSYDFADGDRRFVERNLRHFALEFV